MDIALVYPVAGMSSRFKGKIKQFAKVSNNETLIECSLNQAIPAGFTKIIFIVGEKTEQPFKEKFGDNYKGVPIEYCRQDYNPKERKRPWGSADALCAAKEVLNCPFVFCNGDDLYGDNAFKLLVKHIKDKNICATIGYRLGNVIPKEGAVNRGIFTIEGNFVKSLKEVLGIEKDKLKEKNLSEDNLCSMNIFALNSEVVKMLNEIVENFKESNKADSVIECFLPEKLSELINKKKIKIEIYPTNEKCIGITHPGDELVIRNQLNQQNL